MSRDLYILDVVVPRCLKQLRHWRVPPRWSDSDWRNEITAHAEAAACEAIKAYDGSRSVSLITFVQGRVMASILTRYRQEWAYGLHCTAAVDRAANEEIEHSSGPTEDLHSLIEETCCPTESRELLCCALAQLPLSDRWLLDQLFWQGHTEVKIGKVIGISHQAVSKRKLAILRKLRVWIETSVE